MSHVRRLVIAADRGLLSLNNLEQLERMTVGPSGQPLEYILAVPARRHAHFDEALAPLAAPIEAASAQAQEFIGQTQWNGRRLVVAHEPGRAAEQTLQRRARLQALHQHAEQLAGKLDAQYASHVHRGRRLSDSGGKARFFHEVSDAKLSRIVKVDLAGELFRYDIDERALARAEAMDGKLLLLTNVHDLQPQQIVQRYNALVDIERGFRVLKGEIEIAPVFHRLPERTRADASAYFIALILYRVMRQRLKLAGRTLSPEAALAQRRNGARSSVTASASTTAHRSKDRHRSPRPCRAVCGIEDRQTHRRRRPPIDPAVVVRREGAPLQINDLRGFVSNSGVQFHAS